MWERTPKYVKTNHDLGLWPHLKVYFLFYSNKEPFQYFYMSFKPCNSLILALHYHQGHLLYRPAKVLGEIKITLVSILNNLRSASTMAKYSSRYQCISWRQIFHALSSLLNRNINLIWVQMHVRLSEPGDLRPALCNRLSITPAVPIDRLGNQQLSPSDQSRRGEVEGGKKRWEVEPPPSNPPHSNLVSQGKASLSWGAFGRGLGSLVEVNSSINKHLWTHYRD